MPDPKNSLRTASRQVEELAGGAQRLHEQINRIRADRDLTPDAKARRVSTLQEQLRQFVSSRVGPIREAFDRAETEARHVLAVSSEDPLVQSRLTRAAQRVNRMLDAGRGPADAAQVLAEAGDVAALRVLHEDIPSWAAATFAEPPEREYAANMALWAVDKATRPLLTGAEAEAADVRLKVDDDRAHFEAVAEYAVTGSTQAAGKVEIAEAMRSAGYSLTARR